MKILVKILCSIFAVLFVWISFSNCSSRTRDCASFGDCLSGEVCHNRVCAFAERIECQRNGDCPVNADCNAVENLCSIKRTSIRKGCESEDDCASGLICNTNTKKCLKLPERIDIRIENALIGPGTAAGEKWEGGKIPDSVVKGLAKALGASNPYIAVSAFVAGLVQDGMEPPDPFGFAEPISGASGSKIELPERTNQYNPSWEARFTGGPFSKDLKIRISLQDKDLIDHDDIGSAIIGYEDFLKAFLTGKVYQVNVAEQTKKQILFIGISVVESVQ